MQTLADVAHALNYYEHLVESWEAWAETVKKMVTAENPSQSGK